MPLTKPEHDIASGSLDAYVHDLLMNATDEELSLVPQLSTWHGKKITTARRTSFFEKLTILVRAFKKNVYVVIRDNEKGLTPEKFVKWDEEERKRNYNEANAKELLEDGNFVLGDMDVCNGLMFNRRLEATNLYRYLAKYRTSQKDKLYNSREAMLDVCKMLMHYERLKRRMLIDLKMEPADWYALLYFGDGVEKRGSLLYLGQSYLGASDGKYLARGIKSLCESGHIEKRGREKETKYRITALGIDLLNKILSKYVVNF